MCLFITLTLLPQSLTECQCKVFIGPVTKMKGHEALEEADDDVPTS